MKLKLDENVPRRAAAVLTSGGHDIETVPDEGLAGKSDAAIFAAVREEERMLVTLDRGFADIRRYPPGTHPGVLVLRLRDQRPAAIESSLQMLLDAQDLEALRGCLVIVEPGAIRVRRPSGE